MRFALAVWAAILALPLYAHPDLPAWALHSPTAPDAAFVGSASAIIRRKDCLITVGADGSFITERHVVIEMLRNEGSSLAKWVETYNASSDKVLDASAWLVRNGLGTEYKGKRDWTDVSANADGAIIDETRRLIGDLENRAVKGDLIVFQTKTRSKEFLGDRIFDNTPNDIPRVASEIQIALPAGSTETHHAFGPMDAPTFVQDGSLRRWTLPAMPFVAEENYSAQSLSGLVISFKCPGGQLATFNDWAEVGDYIDRLQRPQCDTSAELQVKVRALTAARADEFARIRALGRYVQDLRYVGINRNLAAGNGYRPRLASEVFRMGYGDCKDKATLLRAMLREAGIKSEMVAAWDADGAVIDETVPSPAWFNHAILAIELPSVPDEWRSAVITKDGKNYLIFDPTDRLTVMGDIRSALQGTRALLCQEKAGNMFTIPIRPAEIGFALKRRMKVRLTQDSSAECEGSVLASGQVATTTRSWIESSATDRDLEKLVTNQMSDRFRQAVVGEKRFSDDLENGSSQLDFTCTLSSFSQPIPGGKMIVKLDLFSQRQTPAFPEKERHKPIQLAPLVVNDEFLLTLQPGMEVSDAPKSAELQSPYGHYSLAVSREEAQLRVTRRYELFRTVIPVGDFAAFKQFLNSIAKADRSAAILRVVGR